MEYKLEKLERFLRRGILEIELGVPEIRRIVSVRFFNGQRMMIRVVE